MTAVAARVGVPRRTAMAWFVSDTVVMAARDLCSLLRMPSLLVQTLAQPVVLFLLFNMVFSGAIATGGIPYIDYLIPAIMIQTALAGALYGGLTLADDMSRSVMERFRTLPMSRAAVLGGRALADTVRTIGVTLVMIAVGYVAGFRFHGGLAGAIGAVALAVAFGHAFSWVTSLIGLCVEGINAFATATAWVFPLLMASSAFVPETTMPRWLQEFQRFNPISIIVDSVRGLSLGGSSAPAILRGIACIVGLIVVFAPLAVRKYQRATG